MIKPTEPRELTPEEAIVWIRKQADMVETNCKRYGIHDRGFVANYRQIARMLEQQLPLEDIPMREISQEERDNILQRCTKLWNLSYTVSLPNNASPEMHEYFAGMSELAGMIMGANLSRVMQMLRQEDL